MNENAFRRYLPHLGWCVVLAPIVYATSCGPVVFLASYSRPAAERVELFYQPLFRAVTATKMETPFFAYARLWGLFWEDTRDQKERGPWVVTR